LRRTRGSGKRVPGSAIRKLEECLAENGMNGCMNLDEKEIFERCKDKFEYVNEKPLYGVIGRALKRGAVYQVKTSSGEIMLCSRKAHVKTLLSLIEDIYLGYLYGGVSSERLQRVKKFKIEIPDIEKSKYLSAVAQHLLSYPNISSILIPDYRAIENAVRTGDLKKIREIKKRLSLKDLNEAVRSIDEGMLKKCRIKALSLHLNPNITESLAINLRDSVFTLVRGGGSNEDEVINKSAENIRSSFNLPPEKLPEITKAIKELYDLFKDVIPLYYELSSRHVETYKKLREEVFKVIREVLDEGDLKGRCFICGEVHYEDEAELLKPVLGGYVFLPSASATIIRSY
jgi:hypothetical protein